jgi:GNAT superfamily N-acetyltransferase
MEERLLVRDSVPDDYKVLTSLIGELGYPAGEEKVRERLARIYADKNAKTLVAELNGRAVGFIGLHKSYGYESDGCFVRMTALVTSEAYRGKGIGTRLVQAAEEWAEEEKASCLVLSSRTDRHEAHEFYQKRGFALTGYSFVKKLGE